MDADSLALNSCGVVYGAADDPAFKLTGITRPDNPNDLNKEQKEQLELVAALIGNEVEEGEW